MSDGRDYTVRFGIRDASRDTTELVEINFLTEDMALNLTELLDGAPGWSYEMIKKENITVTSRDGGHQ